MTTLTLYVQDKLLFIFLFPVYCDSLIVPVFLPYLYICMFRMYESQTDLHKLAGFWFHNYVLKYVSFLQILAVGTTVES